MFGDPFLLDAIRKGGHDADNKLDGMSASGRLKTVSARAGMSAGIDSLEPISPGRL